MVTPKSRFHVHSPRHRLWRDKGRGQRDGQQRFPQPLISGGDDGAGACCARGVRQRDGRQFGCDPWRTLPRTGLRASPCARIGPARTIPIDDERDRTRLAEVTGREATTSRMRRGVTYTKREGSV
jgi:hypothetical protein